MTGGDDDYGGGRFEFFHEEAYAMSVQQETRTVADTSRSTTTVGTETSGEVFGFSWKFSQKHADSKATEKGTGTADSEGTAKQAVMQFEHMRATVEKSNVMKTLINMMQLPSWYMKGKPAYFLKDIYYIDAVIVVRKFLIYVKDEKLRAHVKADIEKTAETSSDDVSAMSGYDGIMGGGTFGLETEEAHAETGGKASAGIEENQETISRGNSVIKFLVLKPLPAGPACSDPGLGMDRDKWMELNA